MAERVVRRTKLELRREGHSVGVLAVDPSSPFTGGAILGDRLRMQDLAGSSVFIRSMASRGQLGGLAAAVSDAIIVLDGAGFEIIFVETVGAGQGEVEIAKHAHTTLVLEAPGLALVPVLSLWAGRYPHKVPVSCQWQPRRRCSA